MGRGEQEEAREPRSVGGLAWEWALVGVWSAPWLYILLFGLSTEQEGKGLTGVDLNHLGLNQHTGPRELLRNLSNSSKKGRGSLCPLFRGCGMPFHLVSCLAGTWDFDYP